MKVREGGDKERSFGIRMWQNGLVLGLKVYKNSVHSTLSLLSALDCLKRNRRMYAMQLHSITFTLKPVLRMFQIYKYGPQNEACKVEWVG